jgi:AcrR family transcriptional regulator
MRAARRAAPRSKSEHTRARIYLTALRLFRKQGFERTTMRGIADEAGLTAGATYYYFSSKREIVLEFYLQSESQMRGALDLIRASTPDFFERLRMVLEYRLRQLRPHRKFIGVLFQNAITPDNPLSPFHPDMLDVRESAVSVFQILVDEGNIKVLPELRPHLPYLLWLYQLGILLFWLFDASPGQRRTHRLLTLSLAVLRQLLRLQGLPFARRLVGSVIALLSEFHFERRIAGPGNPPGPEAC